MTSKWCEKEMRFEYLIMTKIAYPTLFYPDQLFYLVKNLHIYTTVWSFKTSNYKTVSTLISPPPNNNASYTNKPSPSVLYFSCHRFISIFLIS